MRRPPLYLVIAALQRGSENETISRTMRHNGHGVAEVLDALIVERNAAGRLIELRTLNDTSNTGRALRRLLNLETSHTSLDLDREFEDCVGIGAVDAEVAIARIPPNATAIALLFELAFESQIRAAVDDAGGRILLQGALAPDCIRAAGFGLRASSQAAAVASWLVAKESADAIDAIAFSETFGAAAESSRTAALALRSLIAAGHISETEGGAALITLVEDGLIDAQTVQDALADAPDGHDAISPMPTAQRGE